MMKKLDGNNGGNTVRVSNDNAEFQKLKSILTWFGWENS